MKRGVRFSILHPVSKMPLFVVVDPTGDENSNGDTAAYELPIS